jgi:probable rRNA maturation factor
MKGSEAKVAAGPLELDVLIEEEGWEGCVPNVGARCRDAARAAWLVSVPSQPSLQEEPATACLLLTSDERIRDLNRRFRGLDKPTDVLSFPAVEADVLAAAGAEGPPPELGDIAIALQTTLADATREGRPVGDHLSHLVIHGMLHLFGYDHQRDEEAREMEALEVRILAGLGIPDPYGRLDQA